MGDTPQGPPPFAGEAIAAYAPPGTVAAEIRDRLLAELTDAITVRLSEVRSDWISDVARAAVDLDRIAAAHAADTPAPAVDVEASTTAMWRSLQEAGYPTHVSDAAVAALRGVIGTGDGPVRAESAGGPVADPTDVER